MAGSYNTATETCPKISFFFSFESVNLSTFYKGRWHECHLGLFGGQFCEHFSKNTSGLSVQACVAHILAADRNTSHYHAVWLFTYRIRLRIFSWTGHSGLPNFVQ